MLCKLLNYLLTINLRLQLSCVPIFTAQAQVGKYSAIFVPARSGPTAFRVYRPPLLRPSHRRLSMTQSPLDTLEIIKASFSNVFICHRPYFIFMFFRIRRVVKIRYFCTNLFVEKFRIGISNSNSSLQKLRKITKSMMLFIFQSYLFYELRC